MTVLNISRWPSSPGRTGDARGDQAELSFVASAASSGYQVANQEGRMTNQSKTERIIIFLCWAFFLSILTCLAPVTIRESIRDNSVVGVILGFLFSMLMWSILFWLVIRRLVIPKKPARVQWLSSISAAFVVITGLSVVFSLTTERRPKLSDDYWDVISQACEGIGVPEAASYTGGAGIHKVVMVDSDGDSIWYTLPPLDWQPDSVANTELVVCVGATKCERVGWCRYVNGPLLEKNRCHRWIRLVSARTGELVSAQGFYGDKPSCPGSVSASRTSSVSGGDVDRGDVMDWLTPFVEP
jgi:hypothetical protein